ncbi:MAG TPA: hypothetical protein VFF01_07150, partial [Candidatus Deferrimicrobiaceae bacterium]|nr:hypothetical protein [Candidatus Deferrimicrobiaceae bacterium]
MRRRKAKYIFFSITVFALSMTLSAFGAAGETPPAPVLAAASLQAPAATVAPPPAPAKTTVAVPPPAPTPQAVPAPASAIAPQAPPAAAAAPQPVQPLAVPSRLPRESVPAIVAPPEEKQPDRVMSQGEVDRQLSTNREEELGVAPSKGFFVSAQED